MVITLLQHIAEMSTAAKLLTPLIIFAIKKMSAMAVSLIA